MAPNVIRVVPMPEYTVNVLFEDGKLVNYDVKPMLEKGLFVSLQEERVFQDTCTVMNGTLAWDLTGRRDDEDCIDIDPETLYGLQPILND